MYRSKLPKPIYSDRSLDKLCWSCSAWPIKSLETIYGSLYPYKKYTFSPLKLVCIKNQKGSTHSVLTSLVRLIAISIYLVGVYKLNKIRQKLYIVLTEHIQKKSPIKFKKKLYLVFLFYVFLCTWTLGWGRSSRPPPPVFPVSDVY